MSGSSHTQKISQYLSDAHKARGGTAPLPIIMLSLTIAIPVKNEARQLPACLEAIGKDFADRVVVIDSASSDETQKIAREWGAEVLDFHWDGGFPKKRNWFLRKHTPTTEWILFLDADEIVTDAFKTELKQVLPGADKTGFWLNYSVYFRGKALKGGYPMRKLALFRVGAGEYERIDEDNWSHLDMEIHEHPVLTGAIGNIRARIEHRDLRGMEHWHAKHREYALWESRRYLDRKRNPAHRSQWTPLQKVKYCLMGTPLIGPAFFLGSFILMGGFRDGWRGFGWALHKAAYFNLVYRHIQDHGNAGKSPGNRVRVGQLGLLAGVVLCMYLAWRPSPFLSEVWWIPREFARWADGQFNLRTAIPFAALGLIATLIHGNNLRRLAPVMLGLAFLGVVLEIGQLFIATRSFQWGDIGFAWLGAAIGLTIGICLNMVINTTRRSRQQGTR